MSVFIIAEAGVCHNGGTGPAKRGLKWPRPKTKNSMEDEMTQLTDRSPKMIALCKEHQTYIRRMMGKCFEGMCIWRSYPTAEDEQEIVETWKRWMYGINNLIFIPNLGQLVRWVPEDIECIQNTVKDKAVVRFFKAGFTAPVLKKKAEAPTPEQAMLLSLVAYEGTRREEG